MRWQLLLRATSFLCAALPVENIQALIMNVIVITRSTYCIALADSVGREVRSERRIWGSAFSSSTPRLLRRRLRRCSRLEFDEAAGCGRFSVGSSPTPALLTLEAPGSGDSCKSAPPLAPCSCVFPVTSGPGSSDHRDNVTAFVKWNGTSPAACLVVQCLSSALVVELR